MKTQQGSNKLGDAIGALDTALLEKLAANIMAITHAELEYFQPGQDGIQPMGERDDGL
jgi:hypothetical protein